MPNRSSIDLEGIPVAVNLPNLAFGERIDALSPKEHKAYDRNRVQESRLPVQMSRLTVNRNGAERDLIAKNRLFWAKVAMATRLYCSPGNKDFVDGP